MFMKILRWIGIAFLISLLLMASLVALAPTILSTQWGNQLCLKAASHVYPGSVTLQSLSLGWTSGVDVKGLAIKDQEGRDLFSCSQLTVDKPLLFLAFSQKDIGTIKVQSPIYHCYSDTNAKSSGGKGSKHKGEYPKKKGEERISHPLNRTPDLKGIVDISDAQLIALVNNRVVGDLSQGTVHLDLDLLHSSQGSFTGTLARSSSKPSPLNLSFSLNGAPQLSEMKGTFSFSCSRVPTELLAVLAQGINPDIADFLKETFGSSVSYSLTGSMNGPSLIIHSSLTSDNVHSDINLHVADETISVDKGELFSGTVTPRLFQLLIKQASPEKSKTITLLSPTVFSIENKLPLSFDLSGLTFSSPLDLQCSAASPFQISVGASKPPLSLTLLSKLQGDPEKPSASLLCSATSGQDTARLQATTSATKQEQGYHLLSQMNVDGKWGEIIESMTGIPAASLVGPDVGGTLKAEGDYKTSNDFSFQGMAVLSSQNIQEKASFVCTQDLFSLSDASVEATLKTSLVQKYAPSLQFQNSTQPIRISSNVKRISIPLSNLCPDLSKAIIDATAKASIPALLLQKDGSVSASIETAELSIIKNQSSPLANFSLLSSAPISSSTKPMVTSLVGASGVRLVIKGWYDFPHNTVSVENADISGARFSANIHDLNCSMDNGLSIGLSSPATARLSVNKEILSLIPSSPLTSTPEEPTEVNLTIKPFSLSLKNGSWQGSKIVGEVHGKNIRIAGKEPLGAYTMLLPLSFDPSRRIFTSEPTISSGTEPVLKGTATVLLPENGELPLLENTKVEISAEVKGIPTALIDLVSPHALTPVLGESLFSTIFCRFNGLTAKGNRLTVSSSGTSWKANVDFALDAGHLSSGSSTAIDIEATISPSRLEAIKRLTKQKSTLTIGNDITVHFKVPSCSSDLSSLLSPSAKGFSPFEMLDTSNLSAELSLSEVDFLKQATAIGRLSPLTATVDLKGTTHSLRFTVDSTSSSPEAMAIALKGSFDNIWNKEGLTFPSSHLQSTVTIDRFPTQLLDLILPQKGALLEETIGKTIRVNGEFSVDEMKSGSVKFDLQAKNCSVHLDGTIENGTLTLNTPAKASLSITKETGNLLLKDVHPLLATAVRAEKPIQLTIDSQGAAIPISPFSMTLIRLPKVTADVGKIVVKNGGALKIILALLNMGDAANGEDLNVWLTPLYVKVQNGVVTFERADALVADKLHMITWGNVDLGHEKINMIIAIPQESLEALKLQIITTTPERGLQIPITGSSSNPKIDTNRAAARLAGAGLLQRSGDKRVQMFGGLLQAAAATMGEPDQPIPAPTTQPFPWAR